VIDHLSAPIKGRFAIFLDGASTLLYQEGITNVLSFRF
jgi:hypothetical protein